MEAFLRAFLPRSLPESATFEVHPFQGKADMLGKLEVRLRGYARWLPPQYRIVVLMDRDGDQCSSLKLHLEEIAERAGLQSRTQVGGASWQLVNRLAVEELEAWYFGDWVAVRAEFPRVSANIPRQQNFRNPDAVQGGTWEAFERIMRKSGYFEGGLRKIEAARRVGGHVEAARSTSASFLSFCNSIREAFE